MSSKKPHIFHLTHVTSGQIHTSSLEHGNLVMMVILLNVIAEVNVFIGTMRYLENKGIVFSICRVSIV